MKDSNYVIINSGLFPVLKGEDEELINPGTYGKALAVFIREQLEAKGYNFSFIVCEDFGWWVEFKGLPFHLGIICRVLPDKNDNFLCGLSIEEGKVWSWKRFWFVDTTNVIKSIKSDILTIFNNTDGTEIVENYF